MKFSQENLAKSNFKLSLTLIASMVLTSALIPVAANATDVRVNCSTSGSFLIQDNVVVSSIGCTGEANIPVGVTAIGESAFDSSPDSDFSSGVSLSKIELPSTVTGLGRRAFAGASALRILNIPNSVTSIGDYAFAGASSLRSITIGSGLEEIGSSVFAGASSLRTLTIPSNINVIGSNSFANTTSLTKVRIMRSMFFIGDGAFSGATSLNSIYFLEAAPTYIGDNPNPFASIAVGATAYVTEDNLASFPLSDITSKWNGLSVEIGDPVASDFTVQQEDGEEVAAAAAAVTAAAAKAAVAAAIAQREAEVRTARAEIVEVFKTSKPATAESFAQAEIRGITKANVDAVNAEIALLPQESRTSISEIVKIARKFEVVGVLASDQIERATPNLFVEIGLISAENKNKTEILRAIRGLSAENRSSYASIKSAIAQEMIRIQMRKDRLTAVLARISGGSGK